MPQGRTDGLSAVAAGARRAELEAELGEPITLDGLTARWTIFQRKHGHRHSTDDLVTAWYALAQAPHVAQALDLGTGIGGVGLLVLSGLAASAELTCIEAQDISYRFLVENIAANGLADRVHAMHGDLRDLRLRQRFALVTGSPPYFPTSAGIVPADSQKAHARFELRGDLTDYAHAAKRHLAPGGVYVFCFPWHQHARALAATAATGLAIEAFRAVVPRAGLEPLFAVYACRLGDHAPREEPPFVVRDASGAHTEMYRAMRRRFGWE
jgi:tRNA1Val (adenine37-N6)-methyltransferase